MSHESTDFVTEFAHLVWLLVHRPAMVDEQKASLRHVLAAARLGRGTLSLTELNHTVVNGAALSPVPAELPWLTELAARMAGHSAALVDVSPEGRASDVLGVARVLASQPVHGDDGATFDARVVALSLTTVSVRIGRGGFTRSPTPVTGVRAGAPPARTPSLGNLIVEPPELRAMSRGIACPTPAARLAYGLHYSVPPSPTAMQPVAASSVAGQSVAGSGVVHDGMTDRAAPAPRASEAAEVGNASLEMMETAFSRSGAARGVDGLYAQLDGEISGELAPRLLDDLVRVTEEYARDGLWVSVVEVLGRLIAREATVADPTGEVKRAFLIHLRRLFKPGILRGVAQLMGRRRDLRDAIQAILVRSGEAGADVLLELMIASNLATERRAYRSALVHCPGAAMPLMHLLADERWYVARNAADLLGEMHVTESDAKLIATLKHADLRVRRSVVTSLARLATSRAVHALQSVLQDPAPEVRLAAVHGLAQARNPRSAPALVAALDREDDPAVQHALLASLGLHPTDEAVARLTQAAQPGSLLNRRPAAYRVAAINALGDAATPAAASALRPFVRDRDRDVRAAAERALADHAHGTPAPR